MQMFTEVTFVMFTPMITEKYSKNRVRLPDYVYQTLISATCALKETSHILSNGFILSQYFYVYSI